ncbi:MAG: thermonuclease family protein [Thermodesulfobacteriota bacterium]
MARCSVVVALMLGLCLAESLDNSAFATSPRLMLYGRAKIHLVESVNLCTLRMVDTGQVVAVRLVGVGSPLNRDRLKSADPALVRHIRQKRLWQSASNSLETLLHGKVIQVWSRKWDRHDDKKRLLVYLKVPNSSGEFMDVNGEIIRRGLGFVTRDYVHVTFAEYKLLEQEARVDRRGFWAGLPHREARR